MNVLVADKFPASALERLRGLGFTVVLNPDLKDQALVEELKKTRAEALVVRST